MSTLPAANGAESRASRATVRTTPTTGNADSLRNAATRFNLSYLYIIVLLLAIRPKQTLHGNIWR